MAVKLGFGGLANTNGARSFAGKAAAIIAAGQSYFFHFRRGTGG